MARFSANSGSTARRCVLMLIGLCLGAEAFADQLQVVTSNGPVNGGQVPILYGVSSGIPGTPTLSGLANAQTSPNFFSSFVSLAYVPNNTLPNIYDVIAVDQGPSATTIWRLLGSPPYAPAAIRQVWANAPYPCTMQPCSGPQQALKVAVDGDGTLYVLSSDPAWGNGGGRTTELWAFRKNTANTDTGFANPILVDAYVAGVGPNGTRDYAQNNIHGPNNMEPLENPATTITSTQSIILRSGNGAGTVGSLDTSIRYYSPADGSIGPFVAGNFASASAGPFATVVQPYPVWVQSLSADPAAKWINPGIFAANSYGTPVSALYAYPFNVAGTAISSASLTINYAFDNELGEPNVPGLYLNGTAVAGSFGEGGTEQFTQQHTFTNNDVGSLLTTGANTLYLYQYDFGVTAGAIFSATINVTSGTQNYDMIVAPAGVAAPLSAGDVLVMFGDAGPNKAVIADYNAAKLQTFVQTGISQCNGVATCTGVNPLTVLNSDDLGFAAGEAARSLAVWPKDSHVMLLTMKNVQNQSSFPIYKFTWNSASQVQADPLFASDIAGSCSLGTPCGPTTLRTGVQSGISYAFVTAPAQLGAGSNLVTSPSQLLELTQPGGVLSVTVSSAQSDGALTGLAAQATGTTGTGTGTGSGCISGCNITGGANQTITGTTAAINAVNALTGTAATITEVVCKVAKDPRKICGGTITTDPNYNAKELPVKSVCPDAVYNPSFGNSKIPDYICGNYADTLGYGFGTGFELILGRAEGIDAIPGLFIKNDVNPQFFFNSPSPACPQSATPPAAGRAPMGKVFVPDVFAWGTWSGSTVEGLLPEGNNLIDLGWGCGGGTGHSSGNSLMMLGGRLDLTNATKELGPNPTVNSFLKFATYKYANLGVEVLAGNISTPQKARLAQLIAKSAVFLASGGATNQDCAANKLWSADRYVTDKASNFFGTPGIDPNPYGRIRSRLANLFYVVFSEIEGQPPPVTWPALPAPGFSAPGALCPTAYLDADGY